MSMSADIYMRGSRATRVDVNVPNEVNPADAYRLVLHARGHIGAMLRQAAMTKGHWDLWCAKMEWHGGRRHRRIKHARDTLRRLQKMEMQKRGWR